jgi:zinc dependent phospholipase C
MKRLFSLVTAVLALLVLGAIPVFAFSSFEIYGGATHKKITEEALARFKFSSEPLKYLNQGLLEPDKFYRDKFTNPEHHFTEQDFPASLAYLEERYRQVVENAGSCSDDYECYRQTLFILGECFHAAQDFYAHTNWVETHLTQGHREIPLFPFQSKEYSGLVSPYFLYKSLPPKELTNPKTFEKEFGLEFYPETELESLTDRERIKLVTAPEKAFTHRSLAKDNPEYPQSSLVWRQGGPTLFDFAYDAAVRDTRLRWSELRESLWTTYPESAPQIDRLLRKGWSSDLPEEKISPEFETTRASLVVGQDFSLHAILILKPSSWNQRSGNSIVELYTQLVSDQVSSRDTFETLQLRKNRESQTFEIEILTDLPGGAETFMFLHPVDRDDLQGDWNLRIELPTRWQDRVTFQVEGPSISKDLGQNKYLLVAPKTGWTFPSWIESYVEGL